MRRLLPVFLLMIMGVALCSMPLPVHAQAPSLTLGLVAGPQGLVRDRAQAEAFAHGLAPSLAQPLRVRLFNQEDQLFEWLTRYREVDCAWLSNTLLDRLPAGEILPLVAAEGFDGVRLPGLLVARQGLDAAWLQQLVASLLTFDGLSGRFENRPVSAVARFVPVAGTAVAARSSAAIPPSEPPPYLSPTEPPSPADPAALPSKKAEPQAPEAEAPVAESAVPSAPVPAAPVPAEPESPPLEKADPPVSLEADRLDYDGRDKLFQAGGNVLLQQGETTLVADELLWQEHTGDAAATGNVRLSEPGGELRSGSLHANLATGLGFASDGRVVLKDRNFHLAGSTVERLGEATYRVTDGRFTTCDGEIPDWQFTADEVNVELGNYAVARDVWFEVADKPLLYLPYLLFPVKSERESGFLLPRIGYSSRKGALLSLAWYEVIDRHLDATVYIDYLSRLGVGKGLEYRYALGRDSRGEALYYHVSGIDETPDSYAIDWQHEGKLPGGVRLAADVEYVSRKEFFEDFGEAADEYNRDETVSVLLMQRNWDKLNLTGYARYIKDLENDNDATLQRLPEIGLGVPFLRLDEYPLYASTDLRGTNFWREEGEEGQRLFLRQGLSLVLKPGSWLEFTPEIALYGRAYHVDSGDESDLIPEYSATLSTRLLRVFPFERWGVERVQHSIEPQIRYVYIPNEDQDDLPFFDVSDRIGPLNQVEYALINRLTARFAGSDGTPNYREVANLRLSQRYDIREERDDAIDDPEPFSDLRTELTLRPTPRSVFELDAYTRVHDDLKFSRFRAGGGYDDEHGNVLRLDYIYRDGVDEYRTDYLQADLTTSLLAPVHVSVSERYDFRDSQSLETVVGLEYRSKCWSLFLTFRDRPDSEEVLIGFALSGLGQVGGFGSRLRPLDN